MPCYEVNLMSVKIEAADKTLLKQAAQSLGFLYSEQGNKVYVTVPAYGQAIEISNTTAKLPDYMLDSLNQLKQAYSQEVIEEAARQFNWVVDEEEDNQLVLYRYEGMESY